MFIKQITEGFQQLTENMSDWTNAGVAKPVAQWILKNRKFSHKGKFTDIKKPKASEVKNGDLIVGDGGDTVIFNRQYRDYGASQYVRVMGIGDDVSIKVFSSISQAFKGVKGPWKKLEGGGNAAIRDKDQGGKSVPPSDILGGGGVPEYGWLHMMEKMYWSRLQPKLEAMADQIFAGLRKLPRDRSRYGDHIDPQNVYSTPKSARHEALRFANAIEDIAEKGFTKKNADEFLQSLGKYDGGYGSAISNREELNKILSTQPGRAKFAKFILDTGRSYVDDVNEMHDEFSGVNDAVRKLRGESVEESGPGRFAKSDASKRAERNAKRREKRAADRAERDTEKAASAAKEKKLLNKYWSVFTDEVAQGYPDSDPIDNLVLRYRDFDYDKLEAAAKMHGYDHPMDYYDELDAQIKADRAHDDKMSKGF